MVRLAKAREQELQYKKEIDHLEMEKQQKMAEIEIQRFKQMVDSIGSDTLAEMARAGPELQVNLINMCPRTFYIFTRISEAIMQWWKLAL